MRKVELANGEYYHIYNRGVDKREVFSCVADYERFLLSMNLLNDERDGLMQDWRDMRRVDPRVQLWDIPELNSRRNRAIEIVAYCINPNHYHFILKQIREGGIKTFMQKLSTSYTNYFNVKYKRSGSLFQGRYKSAHIDSNEYLLYLSVYVNKNNFIHGYNQNDNWPYSSLPDYLDRRNNNLVNKEVILGQFKNIDEYKDFINNNALYMREKKELEKYLIEE
jgi:putative transposase